LADGVVAILDVSSSGVGVSGALAALVVAVEGGIERAAAAVLEESAQLAGHGVVAVGDVGAVGQVPLPHQPAGEARVEGRVVIGESPGPRGHAGEPPRQVPLKAVHPIVHRLLEAQPHALAIDVGAGHSIISED